MSNRRTVQILENITDYSLSFQVLILSNEENLQYIDDVLLIDGFVVKLNIHHINPSLFLSSNPDYDIKAFRKLEYILCVYDREYSRDECCDFDHISWLWPNELKPIIKHSSKIPKLLIQNNSPKMNIANMDKEHVDESSAREYAKKHDMIHIQADNYKEFSNVLVSMLSPIIRPMKLYLVNGFLRDFQDEYEMRLPLDIIDLCNLWYHGSIRPNEMMLEDIEEIENIEELKADQVGYDIMDETRTYSWQMTTGPSQFRREAKERLVIDDMYSNYWDEEDTFYTKKKRRFSMGNIGNNIKKKAIVKLDKLAKKKDWMKLKAKNVRKREIVKGVFKKIGRRRSKSVADCYYRMN